MANPLFPVFVSMHTLCKISARCNKWGGGRGTTFSNLAKAFLSPKTRLKFPMFEPLSVPLVDLRVYFFLWYLAEIGQSGEMPD